MIVRVKTLVLHVDATCNTMLEFIPFAGGNGKFHYLAAFERGLVYQLEKIKIRTIKTRKIKILLTCERAWCIMAMSHSTPSSSVCLYLRMEAATYMGMRGGEASRKSYSRTTCRYWASVCAYHVMSHAMQNTVPTPDL